MPESTICTRLAEIKPQSKTRTNSQILAEVKEESLVKQIMDADNREFSIRPEFLREMAEILLIGASPVNRLLEY